MLTHLRSPTARALRLVVGAAWVVIVGRSTQAAIDFATETKPVIEAACLHCHNSDNAEGGLRLDDRAGAIAGGDSSASLLPGDPEQSPLYTRTVLPADDLLIMPPDGAPLDETQTSRWREWIKEGAQWPKEAKLAIQPRIDFEQHVQPILETNCVSCHSGEEPDGLFDLTTHATALESGTAPPSIVPFKPDDSPLYTLTIVDKDDLTLMPPADQGGPLPKNATEILRMWIAQGAIWPEGVTLKKRPRPFNMPPSPDNMQLVQQIHALIVERSKADASAEMSDYEGKIPQTGVPYHMVAIEGGESLMGSPPAEPGRQENEGPQRRVEIAPFWMGKYEVTWDETASSATRTAPARITIRSSTPWSTR
jgi:hypothetical protein